MKKNLPLIIVVILAIVIAIILPKNPNSNFFSKSGGGISLKDMNKKDSCQTNFSVILQANQTTQSTLLQGLLIADYYKYQKGFYYGGSAASAVSTQYGILSPTLFFSAGKLIGDYKLDYRVGKFKRTSLISVGIDPQYSNFCTDLNEGGSAKNAMQLSLIKGNARIGFGHQGQSSFYDFDGGCWYGYLELPVCKQLMVSGGVDLYNNAANTGYFASKLSLDNNVLVVTGNKLGTEAQSFIVTYNRNNIPLRHNKMMLAVSAWTNKFERGAHFVAGLAKGKGNFFAQFGSNYNNSFTPYFGVGTSYIF